MRTVYIHTTPDGKKYVGATHIDPNKRFKNGLGYRYQFFYQAVLKFSWENISHQLYEVDTEEELKYLEKYLISYYDTTNPEKGYNIAKGDSTQDHGTDHPEFGNGGGYSQNKESHHKYYNSKKGRAADKRYRTSEKCKLTRHQWLASDKGKESIKLASKRYDSSEKGKEAHRRAYQRRLEKKKKQMKNE